jgi:hypothetical protein
MLQWKTPEGKKDKNNINYFWPATLPPCHPKSLKTDRKLRKILARTREGSRAILQKNSTKLSLILFPVFSALLLYFWLLKNICSSLVCKSNDPKNCPISLMNEKNIGKCSMIGTSFGMWYKEWYARNPKISKTLRHLSAAAAACFWFLDWLRPRRSHSNTAQI